MANWKRAIKELENLNKDHTDYGQIAEHDMYNGRAEVIVDNYDRKMRKKYIVEEAERIVDEKKKRHREEVKYDMKKR